MKEGKTSYRLRVPEACLTSLCNRMIMREGKVKHVDFRMFEQLVEEEAELRDLSLGEAKKVMEEVELAARPSKSVMPILMPLTA